MTLITRDQNNNPTAFTTNARAYFLKYNQENTRKFLEWFGLSAPIKEELLAKPNYTNPTIPNVFNYEHVFNTNMDFLVNNVTATFNGKAIALPYLFQQSMRQNAINYCLFDTAAKNALEFLYFGFDTNKCLMVFLGFLPTPNPNGYPMTNVLDVFTFSLKETTPYGDILDCQTILPNERLYAIEPQTALAIQDTNTFKAEDYILQIRLAFYQLSAINHYRKKKDLSVVRNLRTSTVFPRMGDVVLFDTLDTKEPSTNLAPEEVLEEQFLKALGNSVKYPEVLELFYPADTIDSGSPVEFGGNKVSQLEYSLWAGCFQAYGDLELHSIVFGDPLRQPVMESSKLLAKLEKERNAPSEEEKLLEAKAFQEFPIPLPREELISLYRSKFGRGYFSYRPLGRNQFPEWPDSPLDSRN